MADTGILSGTSSSGNAIVGSTAWFELVGSVGWLTSQNCTVIGFSLDIPTGSTIVGAIVHLTNTYALTTPGVLDIHLSIDGGSNFSDAISTGNLSTTFTDDVEVGDSSELWGLDWPSSENLGAIHIKGTSTGAGVPLSDMAQIQIYYQEPLVHTTSIISGKVILKSGKLTIK